MVGIDRFLLLAYWATSLVYLGILDTKTQSKIRSASSYAGLYACSDFLVNYIGYDWGSSFQNSYDGAKSFVASGRNPGNTSKSY